MPAFAYAYLAVWVAGYAIALTWLVYIVRLVRYIRRHPRLNQLPDPGIRDDLPRVCVIVPACDEGATIERCLRSLAHQDYPHLHIVAINDRSTDETGRLMDRVAGETDRLTVLHVEALPADWLGKNHANHLGASTPTAVASDLLLFTDGDILFEPDCVRRAVAHLGDHRLDHLALMPHLVATGLLEKALCHFFGVLFMLKCRVWAIENPRARAAFCGVGAFNLVTRAAYDEVGGHETLRLEVVDDYKLGKLMKLASKRTRLTDSGGKIRVRWQVGLGGVVRGFEKNAFAGCDYSLLRVARDVGLMFACFFMPALLALVLAGPARWGWVLTVLMQFVLLGHIGRSYVMAALSPLLAATMIWAVVRSVVLTLWRGGVVWRGTHYPLAQLRRGLI